jgi:hypothetical protein
MKSRQFSAEPKTQSHLALWRRVWDLCYQEPASGAEPGFNIVGWKDSYTQEPIPVDELRLWVELSVCILCLFLCRCIL